MISLTVRADGEIVGEYSGATEVDLAFRVAAACAKNRRVVTVFDGEYYLDDAGGRHSDHYIWPMPGPVGRPRSAPQPKPPSRPVGRPKSEPKPKPPPRPVGRPALPGKVINVRIPDADYDALLDLGAGDVVQGISRALAIVSYSNSSPDMV